jgi:protein-S-isoprenylcysteine O-methyltransferase Ste14
MFLDKFKSYIFVFIQFVCLGLIAVTGPLIAHNKLYLVIEVMGILLGMWAVWAMKIGKFKITPDISRGGRLVTSGPYEYIRHPMYASLLLITLALIFDRFSLYRLFL